MRAAITMELRVITIQKSSQFLIIFLLIFFSLQNEIFFALDSDLEKEVPKVAF